MSLLSIKFNFFKTNKILNIFQYILTHLTIINEIRYDKQDCFSNLALISIVVIFSSRYTGGKTESMYLKSISGPARWIEWNS